MRIIPIVFVALLAVKIAVAQDQPSSTEMQHQHGQMGAHEMHDMDSMENKASQFFMAEGAGTAMNPASSPMHMASTEKGKWRLMTHGYAFLNTIQQSGPRGEDQWFSTNHLMLLAQRDLSKSSSFLFRTMLSLEPGTIQDRRYPLLFQTGESAYGKAIVDGQHPHDFFMEISAQLAIALNRDVLLHFYAAPVGDPALGPVAFPHRVSAQELPQATLSHHLQDSTHIANDVLTAGVQYKWLRLEMCGFHGAEPDEGRWDIDQGAIDSWSTRLTYQPNQNWAAQVSTGHLTKPEELEPGDIDRTTASVSYTRVSDAGVRAISFLWGHNHKLDENLSVNSFGVEGLLQFKQSNYLTGRIESVDKEELFANMPEVQEEFESAGKRSFRVNAFTFGYSRDFHLIPGLQTGAGANFTFYAFPSDLKPYYGDHPVAFLAYFRVRLGHSAAGHMHH